MMEKKKTSEKKVWRIFRFAKRYELRDDERKCRRSGLLFTRDFVSPAAGDEAAGYYQQLAMLDDGDGEKFCLLFGLYRRLVNEAGKRSRAYRGYLIDADDKPLSDAAIGRLLKVSTRRISGLLHKLELVKLLERVRMPGKFDVSLNEAPKESKKQSAGSGGGRKKPAKSGGGRPRAENSSEGWKPFKKTKTETETKNLTSTEISNDNGEASREEKKRQQNSNLVKGEPEHPNQSATTTPPAAPPLSSESREAAPGRRIIEFPASLVTVRDNCGPEKIGDIARGIISKYDQDSKQFAYEIYRDLRLPWNPTSIKGRRELGCFASVWMKAKKTGIPPPILDELWSRAVKEAGKLAKRKGRCRKISAVFCTIFNNLLASQYFKDQRAIS